MELKLFSFIDEALKVRKNYREILETVSQRLGDFFEYSMKSCPGFLNIYTRVKSEESIREKLLRNNFYRIYKDPQKATLSLSDLIGLRIECRFIEDEKKIFYEILKLFNIQGEQGYYRTSLDENIYLRLSEKQPMLQQNGFEIYKIDGYYIYSRTKFNFELQIKSMVNLFWGEIDHSVLYKNYNYLITENFFRSIMYSIKDNLSMIDRQLMILYEQIGNSGSERNSIDEEHFTNLLSKIIHDVYAKKVKKELGFLPDFKNMSDFIVTYLFSKKSPDGPASYGENFIQILERINHLEKEEVNLRHEIKFIREIDFEDSFTRNIGNGILEVINEDFNWYIFFRIIFKMSNKDHNEKEFEEFCRFIKYKYDKTFDEIFDSSRIRQEDRQIIAEYILNYIAENFLINKDINYLLVYALRELENLKTVLEKIVSIESFDQNIERIERSLKNYSKGKF
ncbi:(p)ppGpp synthetase [Peptoniphilus sp. GNH]|nr:RelA/SpoT domain protein [Clostridiales bacterium KA00134]UHR03003.1 (p)ppGpp synthetase [Peptoniphilus sp. GNH]